MDRQPAAERICRSRKVMHGTICLSFKNLRRLFARMLDVSTSGLTLMSPVQIRKGNICEIEFNIPVAGETRKINAVSKTQDCVCVGMKGFRTNLQFIQIDSESQMAIRKMTRHIT